MSEFKKVDSVKYAQELIAGGASIITARKTAPVLAEVLTEPRLIETYTSDGNLESSEYKPSGTIIVTAATRDGKPKIDKFGHTNTWPLDPKKFAECFQIGDVDITKPFSGLFHPQGQARKFIQITDDIEFKTGWGTQFLKAGGYLNITDLSGVAKAEFEESYDIEKIERPLTREEQEKIDKLISKQIMEVAQRTTAEDPEAIKSFTNAINDKDEQALAHCEIIKDLIAEATEALGKATDDKERDALLERFKEGLEKFYKEAAQIGKEYEQGGRDDIGDGREP